MINRILDKYNTTHKRGVLAPCCKLLKVKRLLFYGKTQEKSDLFFSNKIANFAFVEV
jgi:hypothetical protein